MSESAKWAGARGATAEGGTALRALMLEDSDDDAELVLAALRRGGLKVTAHRVDNRAAFLDALSRAGSYDVILSDFALPGYTGIEALKDARERNVEIPFLLVSGTIGETAAVDVMRAGAQDYVLKDQLARLPAAVERELREAKNRAEQERMREQLILSERMASAGTLAAGVAHEINNPLAVVMANLDYLASELETIFGADRAPEVYGPVADAQEAARRIQSIVRDVKLFSRPREGEREPVEIAQIIDSSVRMAWNEIRHRARLVKDYGAVPILRVNEARLGQVILNLVTNAAQAIPEGRMDANEIRVSTRSTESGGVFIEISDTGCGIAEADMERIFEPFFTTKPVGVGTGLGLAICRRVLGEIGGEMAVSSTVGKGTRFSITLPAELVESRTSIPPPSEPSSRRRGRVLLVDDEESVGRAIARRLGKFHDVTVVTTGAQAVARIAAGERYSVILCDLMMPVMTGVDVHAEVAKLAPDQAARIVFLTGGVFTEGARSFLESVPNPRVEKPLDLKAALAVISEYS